MNLKDTFAKEKFAGKIVCKLNDSIDVKWESDGWRWIYAECFGAGILPEQLIPYAGNEVIEVHKGESYDIYNYYVTVIAQPDDDFAEIFGSGGGCVNAVCKIKDGWFTGEVNSWGGVWKTCTGAYECFPYEENGFIRAIEDIDELRAIWIDLYNKVINSPKSNDYQKKEAAGYLESLDEDLRYEINALNGIYDDDDEELPSESGIGDD